MVSPFWGNNFIVYLQQQPSAKLWEVAATGALVGLTLACQETSNIIRSTCLSHSQPDRKGYKA